MSDVAVRAVQLGKIYRIGERQVHQTISTAMHARLAFAVAAHLKPDILIVDEVLAVGDAEFQKRCMTKMGDTATSGRTVLIVSHDLAAIESLCSRAICRCRGVAAGAGVSRSHRRVQTPSHP